MGQNERSRDEEDVVIEIIRGRESHSPRDRLTPRMEARRIIDALDATRRRRRALALGRDRDMIRRTSTPVDPADTLAFD